MIVTWLGRSATTLPLLPLTSLLLPLRRDNVWPRGRTFVYYLYPTTGLYKLMTDDMIHLPATEQRQPFDHSCCCYSTDQVPIFVFCSVSLVFHVYSPYFSFIITFWFVSFNDYYNQPARAAATMTVIKSSVSRVWNITGIWVKRVVNFFSIISVFQ